MINKLTTKQQSIFNFIRVYSKTHGKSPSQAEIATATNLRQSNIGKHLRLIANKGFINYYEGEPRGIEILKKGN